MYCSNCGNQLQEGSEFCSSCGRPVSAVRVKTKRRIPGWFKLLLTIIIVGAAVGFWATLTQEQTQNVVNKQLKALRENKITEAYYSYTSKDFQKTTSLSAFRNFVHSYPVLVKNKTSNFKKKSVGDKVAFIHGTLTSTEGDTASAEFKLVKEDSDWKILTIQITGEEESEEEEDETPAVLEMASLVETQLKALRSKDIYGAYYDLVSKDFQVGTPYKDFQKFVQSYPVLTDHQGILFKERTLEDDQGSVTVILNSIHGVYPMKYKLIKEDGEWKIWSLRLILTTSEETTAITQDPNSLIPPVEEQLRALHDNDITKAYQLSSTQFQEVTPIDDFKRFIESFSIFKRQQSANFKARYIEDGAGKLQVELLNDEGTTVVEYTLGIEEDQWKIWGFKIIRQPETKEGETVIEEETEVEEITPEVFLEPPSEQEFHSEKLVRVIQAHLTALREGDFERAFFEYTAKTFREESPFYIFKEFMNLHPEFSESETSSFNKLEFNRNVATISGYLVDSEYQKYHVEYDLIQEDRNWKILHIEVEQPNEADDVSQALYEHLELTHPYLEFEEIRIGREIDEQGIIEKGTSTLSGDVGDVYVNVFVNDGTSGATIYLTLEHLETKASTTPLITTLRQDGDAIVSFAYAMPRKGWPKGTYLAKATSSTGEEIAFKFTIE